MARKPLNRPWTFEDNALLVKLLGDGMSQDQIARRMKRSRSTVENYASRLAEYGAAAGASGTECEAGSKIVTIPTSAAHIESLIFPRLKPKYHALGRVVVTPSNDSWSVSVFSEPGQHLHPRCSADAIEISQELKREYHIAHSD